jgi:formylglycine-generating enzyme required for sulfatase activity
LQLQEIGAEKVLAEPYRCAMADRVVAVLMRGTFPSEPTGNGVPAKLRAQLGDAIGALDPRFDAENYFLPCGDDLGFVAIPGRDDLRFARYPVTVAQFHAFVENSGFKPIDLDCLCDSDHRPVRWVNPAEALAYCEWLTGTGCLPKGWWADLPDEHEWEHASRGGQPADWDYCWEGEVDPERANYDDTGIGGTSVVGCFPANGYGLYDMLGNVWEQTSSLYESETSDPHLVVRGGSWGNPALSLRCAHRNWIHRDILHLDLGVRVVLRRALV